MDHYIDDFTARYHVTQLKKDELATLQRKLDPANFDGADTHLSIEDKYKIRTMLQKTLADLVLLESELMEPTGDKKPKKIIWRFYYKK